MNPATTPGPQAANRQDCRLNLAACPDTCGFFASMISRGGRGLPFVCPSLAARGPGPTATWGYTASVAAVSRQVKGRLTDARGESAGLLPSGGRYLPTIAPSPTTSPVRWLVVGHPGRTTYPPQGQRPGCP